MARGPNRRAQSHLNVLGTLRPSPPGPLDKIALVVPSESFMKESYIETLKVTDIR